MAGGIPINSLQDMLLLREIQNQANPFRSGLNALAEGVSTGIAEKQAEAKAKKKEADEFALNTKRREDAVNTISAKMGTDAVIKRTIGPGGDITSTFSTPIESGTKIKSELTYGQKQAIESGFQITGEESDIELLNKVALKKQKTSEQETADAISKAITEGNQFIADQADKISDDFTKSKLNKDFEEVIRGSSNITSAYEAAVAQAKASKDGEQPNLGAIDQALVVAFNKMLDPGSVVRESEFARTPESIPVLNMLEAKYKKIFEGGVGLTNEDRKEIKDMSDKLLENSKKSLAKGATLYIERAKHSDVPLGMIFGQEQLGLLGDAIGGDGLFKTKSGNSYRKVQ